MAEAFLLRSKKSGEIGWRGYVFLLLLCLGFFAPGINRLPPTDRDESWFAQATKQMIETQDYVNINFLGTPRYKKPVGIYWLQAASVQTLNPDHLDQIWAYRIPSLAGATIAVLMTAALGALLFNAKTGIVAGAMLASCLDLIIEAHIAKTDAALLAAVMVAQYALACAYIKPDVTWKNAFAFWSAIGIGILLKGPIILLTLFSTLIWLRVTEKNLSWFKRLYPLFGIPYALALVAPWFIAINLASHGKFAAQSGGHDFLAKLWQGQDRGFLPPGLHALIFPAMFFPFSLFSLFAIPDAWRARANRPVRFCLGWIIPTWIVFELSFTKLPHYVLPVYPAIAILTAKFFLDGFPALAATAKHWLVASAVTLWLLIGAVLAIAAAIVPFYIDHTVNKLQISASVILLVMQGVALLLFLQRSRKNAVGALILGSLIFSITMFTTTVPGLKRMWVAREIVHVAKEVAPCDTFRLVSAGFQEPSLAFLAGTDTKLVPNGAYAAAEMQKDPCRVAVINKPLLREFLLTSGDYDIQPYPVGDAVESINSGHGGGTELYFYVLPQTHHQDPIYP